MRITSLFLAIIFITGCEDLNYISNSPQERIDNSSEDFNEYKDSDLLNDSINCKELTDLKTGPMRLRFNVVDFEYHQKYSFKQCRSEIDAMIQKECEHNVKANFYYDQADPFLSSRTNYFCSEKINKALRVNVLFKSDIDNLLTKPLVKFPSYNSLINLTMIQTISSPKQKIKQGYFAVRIDIGDSLNEKYFVYFNNIETAEYLINKISSFLSKT